MGTSESVAPNLSQFKCHQRLGIYRHIDDPRASPDSQPQNYRYLIEVRRQLPNESAYNRWKEGINDVKLSLSGDDIIYLPLRHRFQKTEMCGSGGVLYVLFWQFQMVFDDLENFLKEEVGSRRKNQHPYSEEEVWFMLYSLVRGGMLYEGKNRKIGDMHPSNILVTKEGFLKVISQDSLPFQLTNFQKAVESVTAEVYLAPQEMDPDMLKSGVYSIKDPCKADVFSMGITMLEAITLQNCSYLYIRNPLRISKQKLQSYIKIMGDRYSQFLYHTIMSIVQFQPQKRRSFLELYELLRPYSTEIQQLTPFTFAKQTNASSQAQSQQSQIFNRSQQRQPQNRYQEISQRFQQQIPVRSQQYANNSQNLIMRSQRQLQNKPSQNSNNISQQDITNKSFQQIQRIPVEYITNPMDNSFAKSIGNTSMINANQGIVTPRGTVPFSPPTQQLVIVKNKK